MDLPSSHQVPSGPMTRSRARALETEVTSLLSQFYFDEHETWLLPQTEMLCMIRYQEEPPEDAREDVQVAKSAGEEKQGKKEKEALGPGHPAGSPDIRPPRTPRTSGLQPGNPGYAIQSTRRFAPQPGHPAEAPDIRRPAKPRTSGLQPGNPDPSIQRAQQPRATARTSGLHPGH